MYLLVFKIYNSVLNVKIKPTILKTPISRKSNLKKEIVKEDKFPTSIIFGVFL